MRRFQFRLERVVKWKKQRERLAEIRQLQARMELESALAVVAELDQWIAQTAQSAQLEMAHAVPVGQWTALYDQASNIDVSRKAAEIKVRQAEQRLREADQARTQIAMEVEALQTLRSQQWHEYREEFIKDEQERLDEVGLRLWRRRPAGEGP